MMEGLGINNLLCYIVKVHFLLLLHLPFANICLRGALKTKKGLFGNWGGGLPNPKTFVIKTPFKSH